MNLLTAHGRIAALVDSGFQDWALPVEPRIATGIVAEDTWPADGAAMASISGGLDDLADDCPDNDLLELVRHGVTLFVSRIIPVSTYVAERRRVLAEVIRWGDGIELKIEDTARQN